MKLNQLLEVIDYEYDFADKEWDTTFYAYANNNKYTRQIEVFRINTHYVVCDFTRFINKHKKLIKETLYDVFYEQWASYYRGIIDNPKEDEDAYCNIINEVMKYLLEKEDEE